MMTFHVDLQLNAIVNSKLPVSRAKMASITKLAIKAQKVQDIKNSILTRSLEINFYHSIYCIFELTIHVSIAYFFLSSIISTL